MSKEKKEKDMLVRVQLSLFNKFQEKCEENYRTISEVIRSFMLKYVEEESGQSGEKMPNMWRNNKTQK